MLRWLTAGESHGPALTAILEGLPAGVRVEREAVEGALARRRLGYGRGARMKFEADQLSFLGGMRHGLTLGSPVALQIANSEWAKWTAVMNPEPVDAGDLERASDVGAPQEIARNKALTRPRPGHADLVGMQKYGFDEARPVLERASARETAARVALGAVAAAFLEQATGIRLVSHTVAIGTVAIGTVSSDSVSSGSVSNGAGHASGSGTGSGSGAVTSGDAPEEASLPRPDDVDRVDADPVRTLDPALSAAMVAEIDAAKKDGDTLGGVVEVLAWGLPPGLGSYTHWDRRLDSRLAGALMGIQAIKGVELGEGFRTAARRGSQAHDEIVRDASGRIQRQTLRSGGTEGGMSTGEVLRVRAAMKPISTVPRALQTIDVATGEPATAIHQRSDVCAVPAAGVVAEAMVALVLAEAVLEKFGGDSVAEVRRNLDAYLTAIPRLMGGPADGEGDLPPGADAGDDRA